VKWLLIAIAALALVAAAGIVAGVLLLRSEPEDVRGSSVEFVPTEPATPPAPEPEQKELAGIVWPTYGYTNERIRSVSFRHRPPFRAIWRFGARTLVEFPPAIAYNRLYFANGSGVVYAVNAETGKRAWKRGRGRCTAASPAVSGHTVYMTFLNRPPCNRTPSSRLTGEVVAFSTGVGKVRWRREIGPSETSPLVADGLVYVGDWHGNVWALDQNDKGKVRWRFRTGGEVKGAPTLSGRRLYVGSYDHHLYALNARTGKLLWRAQAQARPLRDRGRFYSTPTAAYGRVYVGATDGKVYSFGATTGKLRWSHSTGGYVYASPAVWQKRVFVGSYSGRFYALDAATGDERWSFKANGPISGSPTVVNGIVYFATLKERTYALDARTGKQLWSFPDGQYTPVVADADRLYLVGHARIYGMVEK
jgi:outer membrane protein assembly factor BamB